MCFWMNLGNVFRIQTLLLTLLQCMVAQDFQAKESNIRFEVSDLRNLTCLVIEVSSNLTFYIINEESNTSYTIDSMHRGSGNCSLRNGSFVNMFLTKGYILQWFWIFTPEPFMEMFGLGFNTVGAEEYLLHGTYSLTKLTVYKYGTDELYSANLSASSDAWILI
uniref:Lysosome-associated membrane glycoprotein 5 n=1 Tax=Mesocestoides corti TaxID=53468 RepID=A0A5K3ER07_MESCO